MRRLVLPAALALVAVSPCLAQAPSVIVGVGGELSEPVNSIFLAQVFADMRAAPGVRLGSYTLRLSWNPAVLQFQSVEPGAFATPVARVDSAYLGVLKVAGISAGGADGVLDLFKVRLMALTAQNTALNVQVTEMSAAVTLTDLLAYVTTLNGSFCPAVGRWGDLDGDGFANSRDALAILSRVVGLPVDAAFNMALGDVNADGHTNSVDALVILSYAVGLRIPGQRVLLPASGACGTGAAGTILIVPDTADLVVGQRARLKAQAQAASGALLTLAVNWTVADPDVAVVDANGVLTGRGPGTTRVTAALGPGVSYSAPVVVRLRRRAWYVNAPVAKRATVQLGTQRWPLSTPQRAFPYVSEGDTIHIQPGVHDYEDSYDEGLGTDELSSEIHAGIVIQGDTLPDGTRPVLRSPADVYDYALDWRKGLHGEVRDVVLRGFYYGSINVQGLSALTLQNVRIETSNYYNYGYGIYVDGSIDTLRVLKSEFMGDSAAYYSSSGIYIDAGARLVVLHDSKFNNWGDEGVNLYDVDSLDVDRSEFNGNRYQGLYLATSYRPSVSARISHSRFIANRYEAIRINTARRVAMDHNYILTTSDDAIQVSGLGSNYYAAPRPPAGIGLAPAAATSPGTLVMQGDSIKHRSNGYTWIDVSALDSVLIDSAWIDNPADTALSESGTIRANYARVTRSSLLNLYGTAINFYGRKMDVDNTHFAGCQVCTWDYGTAIYGQAYNDSGPAITVTNSSFATLNRALYVYSGASGSGPIVLVNNTLDSIAYAVDVRADSLLITDNQMTRIQYNGVAAQPSFSANHPFKTAVILRNQITCTAIANGGFGIHSDYAPGRIEDNAIQNCYYGIYAYNSASYPLADLAIRRNSVQTGATAYLGISSEGRWVPTIYGNRVVGGYRGIYLIYGDTATVAAHVDSNAVSGTSNAAIYLYYPYAAVTLTGVKNRFANNLGYGIYNDYYTAGTRSFTAGAISGNANLAVYNYGPTILDATDNWWGDPAGPPASGANGISTYVSAASPKASDPSDVPSLIPAFASTSTMGVVSAPVSQVLEDRTAAVRETMERERAAQKATKAAAQAERRQARRAEAERVRTR